MSLDKTTGTRRAQDREQILRRQRLLRSKGWQIVVDGIWGPRTAAAWRTFRLGGRPPSPIQDAHERTGTSDPTRPTQLSQAARERKEHVRLAQQAIVKARLQAEQAKRQAQEQARRAKLNVRAQAEASKLKTNLRGVDSHDRRQADLHNEAIRSNRQIQRRLTREAVRRETVKAQRVARVARSKQPEKWTTKELVAVTVDPITGDFDYRDARKVTQVQKWLVANGATHVKVTGRYDRQTFNGLVKTVRAYEREQRRAAYQEVVDTFYHSGVVKPGITQLPGIGAAPKPGELLDLLGKGGFTAGIVWKELTKRAFLDPDANFLLMKEQELDKLEKSVFGIFQPPKFLAEQNPALRAAAVSIAIDNNKNRLIKAIGEADAQNKLRGSDGGSAAQELARRTIGDIGPEQVLALSEARTHEEFGKILKRIEREDELAYQQEQAEKARNRPWWEDVAEGMSWPVDQVEKYAGAAAVAVSEAFGSPWDAKRQNAANVFNAWNSTADDPVKRSEDFFEALEKNHPWWNLAMEAMIDPLNLVPVGGVVKGGAMVTRDVALASEKLGFAIGRHGEMIPNRALRPFVTPFTKGAELGLILPATTGRFVGEGVGQASRNVPALVAAQHVAAKLARGKTEMTNLVSRQARQLVRNGFRSGPVKSGHSIVDLPYNGDTSFHYDRTAADHAAAINTLAPEMARSFVDNLLSAFADDGRLNESEIFGVVAARFGNAARTVRLQRFALNRWQDRYDEVLNEILEGDVTNARDPFVQIAGKSREESYQHFAEQQARIAADDDFRDVMKRGGSYFFGNGDPELVAELEDAVQRDLDYFYGPFARLLQDNIEEELDRRGISLFNEEGGWISNDGSVSRLTRELLRDTFDELDGTLKLADDAAPAPRTIEIDNQFHGREFRRSERDDILTREIAQGTTRIRTWAIRARAAGRSVPETKENALIQDVIDAARAKWQPVPGRPGYFLQPAEKVRVPAYSVRQLEEVWGSAMRGQHPILRREDVPNDIKRVLRLAGKPTETIQDPLANALDRIAFARAYGRIADGELLRTHPGLINLPNGFNDQAFNQVMEFRRTMEEHSVWVQQMSDEALPKLFARQWAFWAAMSHAQSAPLRYLYNGMQAWLDWWVTYTLPLRPAFWVRNRIDNWVKILVAGLRDPRYLFWGGAEHPSIFSWPIRGLRHALTIGGRGENNPAVQFLDDLIEKVWELETPLLNKVFKAHAIDVPPEAIDAMKQSVAIRRHFKLRLPVYAVGHASEEELRNPALVAHAHWKEVIWDLTTSGPEAADKRRLYRFAYAKAIKKGATPMEAFDEAMRTIDKTLFDYTKLTTLEDNLRWLFPFVFFWRKSMRFWGEAAITKPWLPAEVIRGEQALEEAHADQPDWMRRYVDANPVLNTLAKVPGLEYLVPGLTSHDAMFDPMNFFSFNVLYRTFKSENEDLPPDKAGIKFLSGLMDAINDFGLSANPIVRKPLEVAGVFNFRAWQQMFPQTSLVDAFAQDYLHDLFPDGLNIEAMLEDKVLQTIGSDFSVTDKIAERFDYFVQMEIAAQELRGEPTNRAAAEKKIRDYFYVMNAVGYAAGFFPRLMDPQQYHLYKLADEFFKQTKQWDDLTRTEQRAYQLFKRRRWDPVAFDQYLDRVPAVEAYYGIEDYKKAQEFKQRHPEIIQDVDPAWNGKEVFSHNYVAKAKLASDTGAVMKMFKLAEDLDLPHDIRDLAEKSFVTKELKDFWAKNDTPRQMRDEMLRGFYYRHLKHLNELYHAIPESDFKARQGFLDSNPILAHWWNQNNSQSDDLMTFVNQSNADLREAYFHFVDGNDWDGAAAFLKQFPFIFKFTKSEDRVTEDGLWLPSKVGSQHAKDFIAAKKWLDFYGDLRDRDKKAAFRWLDSDKEGAALVRSYFAKYGKKKGKGRSQHAKDYLALKPKLHWFFDVLPKEKSFRGHRNKWEWLYDSDDPAAKELRAYFRKYGDGKGQSQHAKDYLAVKKQLDAYFKMGKAERAAWLKSGSDDAKAVLAFFKKYAKPNQLARAWQKWGATIKTLNPELAARLQFWARYWALPPDERPGYVIANAEKSGVFIYGPLGDGGQTRHDKEQEYLRWAKAHKLSEKVAMYLRFKPMLELMRTLKTKEKQLFLRANPDLQEYLDKYGKTKLTGNKKLDALIESYFKLPDGSEERDRLLSTHPALRRYFDKNATPAERAMHRLLDVYFRLEGDERTEFGHLHPEIEAFFDRKKAEADNLKAAAEVFDLVDPRLVAFREFAQHDIVEAGETMRSHLREEAARRHQPKTIETRRERRPDRTTTL